MTKQSKVILVVAIVGACCVGGLTILLILATLAIPATQSVIRHGNEASAIASLRLICAAEQQYNTTYPERGFACSLAQLGGSAQKVPVNADAAQLIPDDLASGQKAGYAFAITYCLKEPIENQQHVTFYKLTAQPNSSHSGIRSFCIDQDGAITFDPKGGQHCTEPLRPSP